MKTIPFKVGLTGGIGSGKSTVARVFQTLNIPIYIADQRSKALLAHQPDLINKIKKEFGSKSYLDDGALNRHHLAQIVFNDDEQLAKLNSIVHPFVFNDFDAWVQHQDAPFVIKEAAILFESGSDQGLDRIITVSAPENIRIDRVVKRDKVNETDVRKRMDKQLTDEERESRSHYIIDNSGDQSLLRQIWVVQLGIKEWIQEHAAISV